MVEVLLEHVLFLNDRRRDKQQRPEVSVTKSQLKPNDNSNDDNDNNINNSNCISWHQVHQIYGDVNKQHYMLA